jgi:glycosyltransferase involved in cell wall biosynthesis
MPGVTRLSYTPGSCGRDSGDTGQPTVTVAIAVRDGAAYLEECLTALDQSTLKPTQCIVVDDASADRCEEVARRHGATYFRTERNVGSYVARNMAAQQARGEILFFIDADVRVPADTVARVVGAFSRDPGLDALIGSYDASPGAPDLLSQYRNLLHHWVHQHGQREAVTFWTGCGAIRRTVFVASGGFMPEYRHVGDIALGYVLKRAGRRIELDKDLLVKHMKCWSFLQIVRTDILCRAATWTELILRFRSVPNDLGVRMGQRISVALLFLSVLPLAGILWYPDYRWTIALTALLCIYAAMNHSFFAFLLRLRGPWFALRCVPLYLVYHFCCGVGVAVGAWRYLRGQAGGRRAAAQS